VIVATGLDESILLLLLDPPPQAESRNAKAIAVIIDVVEKALFICILLFHIVF